MYTSAVDLYDRLTEGRSRFVRVDELCRRAAELDPLVAPTPDELQADAGRLQKDKQGFEKKQGAFIAAVLADPAAGLHLCHAMLLPRADSAARLAEYERTGKLDLPGAELRRTGKASVLTLRNPRFLNAEDESTLAGLETAIDVATLD